MPRNKVVLCKGSPTPKPQETPVRGGIYRYIGHGDYYIYATDGCNDYVNLVRGSRYGANVGRDVVPNNLELVPPGTCITITTGE